MSEAVDANDADLVARCRAGDAAAWETLVHRYQRLVYTIVRRAGLDEHTAADVFQTVFARLVENLSRIVDPGRLQAWIVTTAKRETLLALERGRRTVSVSVDPGDDGAAGSPLDAIRDESPLPDETLAELQQLDVLRRALDRLDAKCRDLLALLFRDEDDRVPYDEIARRLAMSVGSIGPTRSRCLGKLRGLVDHAA